MLFSDTRALAANPLGVKEGLGFYQLMEQPPRERLIIASLCVGVAESAVLAAIRYTHAARSVWSAVYQVPAQEI